MHAVFDFLRDPALTIALLGVLLGGIAVIISILQYRRTHKRRRLFYNIQSNQRVLSVQEELRGQVQILFSGRPVSDVRLVVIELYNPGEDDVQPEHFREPICFKFEGEAEVLSAEQVSSEPSNIVAGISFESCRIYVPPILLNHGDTLVFKAMLTKSSGYPAVTARIVGVSQVDGPVENKPLWNRAINVFGLANVVALFSLFLFYAFLQGHVSMKILGVGMLFLVLGAVSDAILSELGKSHPLRRSSFARLGFWIFMASLPLGLVVGLIATLVGVR